MWGREGGFGAVLIAAAHAGEAEEALALAGGTLLARVGWDAGALEALDPPPGASVLVVETHGVAEEALARLLPVIDARAWAAPVVAALDAARIDVVAAGLMGPGAQLLVAPSMAERVATLAVAGGLDAGDAVREDDGARARRLEAEIGRIAAMLVALTRTEDGGESSVADRRRGFGAEPGGEEPIDPAAVRRAIRARRMRDQFLGSGLFEDPAWDMLLDLFAAELEGMQVSVSSLCIAAAVAPTTALRWIGRLTGAGLFERRADPADRRRAFIVLSEEARGGMRRYLAALRGAGLVLG